MNARLIVAAISLTAGAAALVAATSALAAPHAKPMHHSKSEKPSDKGTKPGKGKSGTATVAGRALLDAQGNTLLELTTGDFETGAAYSGTLRKADVTHFIAKRVVDNEKYKDIDSPTASYTYSDFGRGDLVTVRAEVNVKKGDNEKVEFDTTVARRPDVAPIGLTVASQVLYGGSLPVLAKFQEMNGDVGARFDCVLLVDGKPAGEIDGVWADAGSTVACQFMATFPEVGDKPVTVRAVNVSPYDDDTGNNEWTATVSVQALPFTSAYASYSWNGSYEQDWREYRYDDYQPTHELDDWYWSTSTTTQVYSAEAHITGDQPYVGTFELRHSMDDVLLPAVQFDLASMTPFQGSSCVGEYLDDNTYGYACNGYGELEVGAQITYGAAVYVGDSWIDARDPVPNGKTYHADLAFTSPATSRATSLDVPIPAPTEQNYDWAGSCTASDPWYYQYYQSSDCTYKKFSFRNVNAFASQ
jgi:hypothetical protein